ncbi:MULTISPECIES: hypothetical protein [unclassified Colwellia]|jgi:hypothetical protein|uniref:hypothetical protein n=1 Tax=unclassified Colwellia TaxID=196834 RepID=UPI0015F39CA4|nr:MULTISPECIES: hypothetical protein [unclassified Colwellia]MBA6233656.1 hypothetical protein [Colwellia sp. MB02u-7]MBA6237282.1 hypothetical protein [Colwellia sp. MB02u-11]MBA6257280.1 hypothetical protein [Colwellia sp. MB3u-28]MBA6258864.1 hypothetical protein [Colwellia sp. MB3u-41]MBA6300527.1 hypothetical protein [Colwellia sp. MB3u-22]
MKKLILIMLLIMSTSAFADVDCKGTVKLVLEWPQQCNGNLAFMLDGNKSNGKYVCTISSKSESMVLSALMSGKSISFRVKVSGETCESLSSHYLTPMYLHVFSE